MKRKNIIFVAILCSIFLTAIAGIIIYSVRQQERLDNEGSSRSPNISGANSSDKETGFIEEAGTSLTDVSNSTVKPTVPVDSDAATRPTEGRDPDNLEQVDTDSSPIVLAFAGDINFDENSKPVARYDREKKGIAGVLSPELIEEMNQADIMMLNNEFAYSVRGSQTPDKSYTFRANPKRVNILKEMGVDIVSLANNHALDYGQDALLDTFTTLEDAGIDYVGAGKDLDRAKAPIYYTIGDTKIAFVAASRVIFSVDWYATDTRPGMIGTYDPTLLLAVIEEAEKNSDFVVVYLHWGVERTNDPVDYQVTMAKQYIDAGADAVIGCHPHVLQGMEFYMGKPIAYSLGNYWFNNSNRETGLLKLYLYPDGSTKVQLLPAMQESTYTYLLSKEEDRKEYYNFMEEISFGVQFDEEGFLTEEQAD